MIFTCNTKPLITAVSQVVIDSNISRFFRKSGILQLTANKESIRIGSEASYIVSEAIIRGTGDADEEVTIFIDALQFKKLISTFTADYVSFEYTDNALIIRAGKSKFTLPKMVDESEIAFNRPFSDITNDMIPITLSSDKWKFIKNRQMFAVSDEAAHPIYRYVWFGADGDVIAGNYDISLFTRSKMGDMPDTCLLSSTIINLLTGLPQDTKLYQYGKHYVIQYTDNSYTFTSEFEPQYESDDFGNYSSDIILRMCGFTSSTAPVKLDCGEIGKFLNQLDILNNLPDAPIKLIVTAEEFRMVGKTSEVVFDNDGSDLEYELTLKLSTFKSVIAKYSGTVEIYPHIPDESQDVIGIKISDGNMVTIIGGIE